MNKVIIQENMRFLTALRLCLFGCKIFLDVKYFTMKIFYKKYFHFIVFGCVSENSFTSVCFLVK